MALRYWNNLVKGIAQDNKTRQTVRSTLDGLVHYVHVSVANLEDYIGNYLKSSLQQGLGSNVEPIFTIQEQQIIIDNYTDLASKYVQDIENEAKKKGFHITKLLPGQFVVRCVRGKKDWIAIKTPAFKKFIKSLNTLGVNTADKVKFRKFKTKKVETGTKEEFMVQSGQFSHTSPTVAAAHFKELFNNLEKKVEESLKAATGEYDSSEITQVLEQRLADMYDLHLDVVINMIDMKDGRKAADTYEVRGEFVAASQNPMDGPRDAPAISDRVKEIIRKKLQDEVKMKGEDLRGSPKMSDRAADAIIDRFRKKIKSKNITVKSEKLEKVKKKRTIKNIKSKGSTKRSPRKLRAGKKIEHLAGVGVGLRKQVSKENTRRSNIALAGLMKRLNAALPYMLQRNMVPPKLQYRGLGNPRSGTGPFTSTARVTSLTPMNREDPENSGVNVNYTYGLFPYQTFEPGFAQGSFYRDPRKLIEESLMELMRNIKAERFMKGVNFRRTATGADYKFKRRGK